MSVFVARGLQRVWFLVLLAAAVASAAPRLSAQATQVEGQAAAAAQRQGGEVNLVLPDLSSVDFSGFNGRSLLMGGLVVCVLGLLFGLWTFTGLRNLPVH